MPSDRQGGDHGEDALLGSCYRRGLELCQANGLSSVAYPAISTGVYRFPADRAAGIAIETVADALVSAPAMTRVVFCCFSEASARLHEEALAAFGGPCA
jgi:O-acetyl-ADP-ribose deacetylase